MGTRGKAPGAAVKHLTFHRGQPRYWRSVPDDLRAVVGKAAWTKYFPTTVSKAQVRTEVEALRLRHTQLIQSLRQMEREQPGFLARVASEGGLSALERNEVWLRTSADLFEQLYRDFEGSTFLDEEINFDPATPENVRQRVQREVAEEEADDWAADTARAKRQSHRMRQEAKSIRKALGKAEFDETSGLGTLIPLMRGRQSDKSLDRLTTYLKRFIAYMGGDREPSAIRRADAVGWRDRMIEQRISGENQAQHLAKVSAAFERARSKGLIDTNPFAGVKAEYTLDERKVSKKKRPFSPDELRALIAAANTMPAPFGLIIRCLMLTGARSSEICGLRVRDVTKIDGVMCFKITDEHRTVKNKASVRDVPIPAAVLDEITALRRDRPQDAPLFQGLPPRKQGPAHKLQIDASKLIRKLVSEDKRLTLHCLRHTWRQRAGKLKIDEACRRAILGHTEGDDDHDLTYGARPCVAELAHAIEIVAQSLNLNALVMDHGANSRGAPSP